MITLKDLIRDAINESMNKIAENNRKLDDDMEPEDWIIDAAIEDCLDKFKKLIGSDYDN